MEYMDVTASFLPGEWHKYLPKHKAPSPEWKACVAKVKETLWKELDEAEKEFNKAHATMSSIIRDLRTLASFDPSSPRDSKKKKE